jgi:hypothetical protein
MEEMKNGFFVFYILLGYLLELVIQIWQFGKRNFLEIWRIWGN